MLVFLYKILIIFCDKLWVHAFQLDARFSISSRILMNHLWGLLFFSHFLHFLEPLIVMYRNELLEVAASQHFRVHQQLLQEQRKVCLLQLQVLFLVLSLCRKYQRRYSVLRKFLDQVLSELDEVLFSADHFPFKRLCLDGVLHIGKTHEPTWLVLDLAHFDLDVLFAQAATFELFDLYDCIQAFELSFFCCCDFFLFL